MESFKHYLNERGINLGESLLRSLVDTNTIFINYFISQEGKLNIINLGDKSDVSEEYQKLIQKGNNIIFTEKDTEVILNKAEPAKITDFNLEQKTPVQDRYIQKNLNYLTYDQVKERKATIKSYVICVGQHLTYHVTNNNIYVNSIEFSNPSRSYMSKLDYLLAFVDNFQELPLEIKREIVEGYYLNILRNKWKQNKLFRQIEEIAKNAKNVVQDTIASKEQNIMASLRDYAAKIDSLNAQLYEIRTSRVKALEADTPGTFKRFIEFLKHSPLISEVTADSNGGDYAINIITTPLYIQFWDKEFAKRGLKNIVTDETACKHIAKALIDETSLLGIGSYSITMHFRRTTLEFSMDPRQAKFQNRHWTEYHCLGAFQNPIANAKGAYDPFTLINLIFQYIQTLNMDDLAGGKTLKNSVYVVNKESKKVEFAYTSSAIGKSEEEILS